MSPRPRSFVPLFPLALCAAATAQDPPAAGASEIAIPADHEGREALELELEDALRVGLRGNADLAADELVRRQRERGIRIANAFFEPEVFGSVSYRNTEDPRRDATRPQISREVWSSQLGVRQSMITGALFELTYGPSRLRQSGSFFGTSLDSRRYESRLEISLTQPLLRGAWSDFALADVASAKAETAAARWRYVRAVQDTLLAIVDAYWELVLAREDYRVIAQALRLAEEQLRITNERIRVRELAERDRVSDEAEVARRREELIRAENEIRTREDELSRLLFGDGRWDRNLRPISPIEIEFAAPTERWQTVVDEALEARADLWALKADIGLAEVGLTRAERNLLPRLDLVGSYGTVGIGNKSAASGDRRTFSDSWQEANDLDNPDWTLGLELAIPIGNQAARGAQEQAQLGLERSRRLLYAAQLDVVRDVRVALRDLGTLSVSISAAREAVRLAETVLDTELEKLKVGRGTIFEVQQRNQELLEARQRLIRNQLDYRRAQATLEHARGSIGGLGDDGRPADEDHAPR